MRPGPRTNANLEKAIAPRDVYDSCCMRKKKKKEMLLHALNYANGSANAHPAYVDVLLFDVYIHIFLTVYFSKSQHQRACEHRLLKLSLHISSK